MSLDLGTLSLKLGVDRSGLSSGMEAARRQVLDFGRRAGSDASRSGEQLGQRLGQGVTSGAQRGMSPLGGVLAGGGRVLSRFGALGITALGGLGAAAGLMGVKVAAGNEQAQISFTTMLGSAQKAHVFLGQLQAFAAATPFEFPELQTAASNLISVGIKASDVIPIMTSLGNATSGMGTGSEGVKRATVALQQMNAAGKISAQDLNQLRDAGIPVYDLLTKATGKSTAQIAAMAQAGKLGRKELDQMMAALASGKGLERFNGLMRKQSQSLVGLWSTAKDTIGQGLAGAITPLIPLIKEGLGGATSIAMSALKGLPRILTAIVNGGKDVGRWVVGVFNYLKGVNLRPVMAGLMPIGSILRGMVPQLRVLLPQFVSLARTVGIALLHALPVVGSAFASIGRTLGGILASALPPVLSAFIGLGRVVPPLIDFIVRHQTAFGAFAVGILTVVAAMKAWRLAQEAVRIATIAYTAVQAALDVVLDASTIGIIILAIAGLAAGLIYAYKHSQTFRNVIAAIGRWFVSVGRDVIQWGKEFGHWVGSAFSSAGRFAAQMYHDVIGFFTRMWQAIVGVGHSIATFVRAHWRLLLTIATLGTGLVIVLIVNHWRQISGWFGRIYASVTGWVRSTWSSVLGWFRRLAHDVMVIVDAVLATNQRIWGIIYGAVSGVARRIWQTVSHWFVVLGTAIGGVVTGIWNTAVRLWTRIYNTVTGWAKRLWQDTRHFFNNLKGDLAAILGGSGVQRVFSTAVSAVGRIWAGLQNLAKKPISFIINTVLNNGLIPAWNWIAGVLHESKVSPIKLPRGFRTGGPTGVGGDGEPVGVVHGNEHVVTADEVRHTPGGHGTWERLRAAALQGLLPGYAGGGFVQAARNSVGEAYDQGYCLRFVTNLPSSGIRPGIYDAITAWHQTRPQHAGQVPNAPAPVFWGGGSQGHGHVAAYVGNNQIVSTDLPTMGRVGLVPLNTPSSKWGLPYLGWTGSGSGSAAFPGLTGGGGGGFIDYLGMLGGKVKSALSGLTHLGDSPWVKLVSGVPKMIGGWLLDKAKGAITGLFGTADPNSSFGTKGSNRQRGHSLMLQYGFPEAQWSFLDKLWTRESGWNERAMNASSGAYGIPQALPGSKMSSVGADWRANPNTQIMWGLPYIKNRWGSPSGAWAHELSAGWYGNGTNAAVPGFNWVADKGAEIVLNPQLRRFSGGETVLDSADTRQVLGQGWRNSPLIGEYHEHFPQSMDPRVAAEIAGARVLARLSARGV